MKYLCKKFKKYLTLIKFYSQELQFIDSNVWKLYYAVLYVIHVYLYTPHSKNKKHLGNGFLESPPIDENVYISFFAAMYIIYITLC